MVPRADDEHRDYDRLAVDHVLGGLAPDDQARFRDHLAGCEVCRARVNELRSIATDLQRTVDATTSNVLTRARSRARAADDQTPRRRRGRLVAAALVGLIVGGLAFWNLQLRIVNSVVEADNRTNRQALATLAEGQILVRTDFAEGVRGLVAADDDHVVFDLTALPALDVGEFVVLWSADAEGAREPLVTISGRSIDDARLTLVVDRPAQERLLTVEIGPLTAETGRTVVSVTVPAPEPAVNTDDAAAT